MRYFLILILVLVFSGCEQANSVLTDIVQPVAYDRSMRTGAQTLSNGLSRYYAIYQKYPWDEQDNIGGIRLNQKMLTELNSVFEGEGAFKSTANYLLEDSTVMIYKQVYDSESTQKFLVCYKPKYKSFIEEAQKQCQTETFLQKVDDQSINFICSNDAELLCSD